MGSRRALEAGSNFRGVTGEECDTKPGPLADAADETAATMEFSRLPQPKSCRIWGWRGAPGNRLAG